MNDRQADRVKCTDLYQYGGNANPPSRTGNTPSPHTPSQITQHTMYAADIKEMQRYLKKYVQKDKCVTRLQLQLCIGILHGEVIINNVDECAGAPNHERVSEC